MDLLLHHPAAHGVVWLLTRGVWQGFSSVGGVAPETGFATITIGAGDLLHDDTEDRKRECKAEETNTEPIHKTLLSLQRTGTHTPTPLKSVC